MMTRLSKKYREHRLVWLTLVLFIAFVLRAYNFVDHPSIWADEASAGYESFSLLNTGRDRSNVPLPVYFTEWGSGQNVLHSYLSIPLVAFFGLSPLSVRLTTLFAGILTVALLYSIAKRLFGEPTAFVAMVALAITPWHIMSSRWGHDSNEFPFFLLIGCYAVLYAMENGGVKRKIVAFLPWALSLYSYAVGYLVVPVWVALVAVFNLRVLAKNWRWWLIAFFIFGVLVLPIGLFFIKNFVVHGVLPFEALLPFGMPLLAFDRGAQVTKAIPNGWIKTFFAIVSGFQEGDSRNALVDMASILMSVIPLSIVGIFFWIRDAKRTGHVHLFALWLLACLPMLLLFDFGVLRYSALYLPLIVSAADGLVRLCKILAVQKRVWLITGVVSLSMLQVSVFAIDYFIVSPNQLEYQWKLSYDFGTAIRKGVALATPVEDILVTNAIDMPEMLTAFYLSYPPERYQVEEQHHQIGGMFETRQFGRFHFGLANYPKPSDSFVFVLLREDKKPCVQPQVVWQTNLWQVGRCSLFANVQPSGK
jgi:4-amino-4-deoxy-L-arabinose transferase-like glycosyltransferase